MGGRRGTWAGARIGERPFRWLSSLLSIAAIVFLVLGWQTTPVIPLWYAPDWLRWILVFVMVPAFVLFVASVGRLNPTMIGGDNAIAKGAAWLASASGRAMMQRSGSLPQCRCTCS